MVFNLNHKIRQPLHEETREITRFAWAPKVIGSQVVWLCSYVVLQGYYYQDYAAYLTGKEGNERKGFRVGKWVDLSFKLKGK